MGVKVAVVAGVGPGLGLAVSKRFAAEGYKVAMLARRVDALERMAADDPAHLVPMACDVADPAAVGDAFGRIHHELGVPDCVVFNAGGWARGPITELDPAAVEAGWRTGCFAGFLIGQAAARLMLPQARGSILFTGATASLRGSANFAGFAMAKFGLRALAQSMARELDPRGIHVAHVIIDGQIMSERYQGSDRAVDTFLDPAAIAETYWQLHKQPRTAWAFEVDLRPWVERF